MTVESIEIENQDPNRNLPVPNVDEFLLTANSVLMPNEKEAVFQYIRSGGRPVPASLNQSLFELFFNGCSAEDIHELNPSFPVCAIQWMRVAYKWDDTVMTNVIRNNSLLIGKINKAQVDAAMLMSDMIAVASKKHQNKLRKYLQTGDERCLEGIMTLDNPERFSKMVESLIKLVYREEQVMQIKIPIKSMPQAIKDKVQTITTTATNLISEVAEAKRNKAREKVLGQNIGDKNE